MITASAGMLAINKVIFVIVATRPHFIGFIKPLPIFILCPLVMRKLSHHVMSPSRLGYWYHMSSISYYNVCQPPTFIDIAS